MRWEFGAEALPGQQRAAGLLRDLTGLVLSCEDDGPTLELLIGELERSVEALRAEVPTDARPRVGPAADGEGRLYLDHSRDIGSFNPSFPEYTIEVDGGRASGTVEFPVAYEGPPGLVHGGFLALFFDCVMQHHNCDVGVAGKTATLNLRYRRPTPIATALDFAIERSEHEGRIVSTGRLELEGRTLCEAEMHAVAGDRSNLPAVSSRRHVDGA